MAIQQIKKVVLVGEKSLGQIERTGAGQMVMTTAVMEIVDTYKRRH